MGEGGGEGGRAFCQLGHDSVQATWVLKTAQLDQVLNHQHVLSRL